MGEVLDNPAASRRASAVRVPAWVRWLLARWWALVALVGAALVTQIVLVLLSQPREKWLPEIAKQFATVLSLARTYPAVAAAGALAFVAITVLGYAAHKAVEAAPKYVILKEWPGELPPGPAVPPTIPASPDHITPTLMPRHGALVGRDAEIADLTGRLRAGGAIGVFAVEGMAGVGKTALAAEVVDRLAADEDAFPGGAAWTSCEQLDGPDGLAELWSRVARALGQEKVAAIPAAETRRAALARALAARPRTLLALDNVEPKLDAALAIDTLGVKGSVALLLTARQQVAPDRLEPILLHPLPQADALTLFDRRLQAERAGLTDEELSTARAIVDILGELPLAIEVTAAYAARQRLSLPRVLDELREDRLDATALNQADPNRRMYLRFDRSWQALEPAEQRLFAGLSLLVGASFPRDAARALEAAARAPTPAAGPAGELAALVAYALVEPLANDRLRLHPLLREYAAAKLRDLGPAVESPLGDALLAYWLAYARAHRGLDGLDALENEAPGLMGALEWARRHGRERTVPALTEIVASMEQTRGRRAELAALIRALHDEDDPIGAFALQGMAGVGKTSLARLAMAQLSEDRAAFPGGAVWISAEGLAGPDGLSELWSRVARALGQDKVAAIPAVETRRVALAAAISARPRTLLALDNVEPGLDAYAVLDVLAIRGHTALLLIARQSVAPDRLPAITLLSLPVSAAVDIFRRRLAQVDPSRPTTDDDAHIPGLVEAVGRLPLTIELLAGYAGVQKRPIATLATELAQGGTTAAFRADPRRTLVGSFDRSWDALLPRQRRLFAGLSLLEGASFPRAAALALAQAAPDLGKAADPEADLAVLVAYALVEPLADGRLHLHPLLREYAAAKLRDDLGPAAVAHYREALRRFEQVQSPDAETMRAALRRLGAEP